MKGWGQSDYPQIWFLIVIIWWVLETANPPYVWSVPLLPRPACDLGLPSPLPWVWISRKAGLKSLIDPADWASDIMVKGTNGDLWSAAVAFKLPDFHGSWFLERKVP